MLSPGDDCESTGSDSPHRGVIQEWFGLVREPIEDVEVLPIVMSKERGFLSLEEFARDLVKASSNVTQAILGERMDPYDRRRDDRLEEARYHFAELDDDLDRLSDPSLRVLVRELLALCDRVGREWIEGHGSDSAFLLAWYLDNRSTDRHPRLASWLNEEVLNRRPRSDETTAGSVAHLPVRDCFQDEPDRKALLIAIDCLVSGMASVASAALNTGNQQPVLCLDQTEEQAGLAAI